MLRIDFLFSDDKLRGNQVYRDAPTVHQKPTKPYAPSAPSQRTDAVGTDDGISIRSDALFTHGDVVLIEHEGAVYALRKTRNGKLILTK